jgi:anaerobic selenocysteine-containing dehydrogenase
LELGFKDGDWLIVETAHGSATLQAKLTEGIPHDVVCAQHGWWQACPELSLPGYDPYSVRGANVNLLYTDDEVDPISGSLPIKGQLCKVRRAP